MILEDQETTRLENEGIIDRRIYDESRRKGQSHAEALEAARGPVWLSIQETKHFLDRLAQSVYAFDRDYLLGVSGLLSDQSEAEKKFVSLALLPFLKAFGYQQLKQRYIDGSVQRISSFLEKQGVRSLADMEPSFAHRRLALQMLGASLTTSQSQMNDMQKSESARMLSVIGEAAASPLRQKDMQEFLAGAQGLEKLLLDLAQNPYLTARSATDMALLVFLRN